MIERYGKIRDVTDKYVGGTSGKSISRMCFGCNKARADLGGQINKKTRMWYCAACVIGKEAKK